MGLREWEYRPCPGLDLELSGHRGLWLDLCRGGDAGTFFWLVFCQGRVPSTFPIP